VAAVYQDRELDAGWTAEVRKRVHGGADAASRVQHVVDEHDAPAIDIDRHLCALKARTQLERLDVIAVQADVQLAYWHRLALEFTDGIGKAAGERDAACMHANEGYAGDATVVLDDLVGDAADSTADIVGGEDDMAFR
jgi:hypothetical protein